MQINRDYISDASTYANNVPVYIVIHNTDNYAASADALAHVKCQFNQWWTNGSCHYYVDDGDVVYQAAPHNRGCWHVGRNYGGRLYGIAHNRNSVGIEMCVNTGYDYERAFQNTVELCKYLMQTLGINADHVIQHYDVCAKNCPSAIRAKGDWARFKKLISGDDVQEETKEEFNRTNSGTCTGDGVRVRRGPDTSYGIVSKLNKGNRFDVDGQISNGWYHVRIKNASANMTGWMYGDYVQLDAIAETVVDPSMPFTDVNKNDFYYNPVKWAVENKITTGVSHTKFAPLSKCTRADAIVLIWRMMGSPEPTTQENPFVDVAENDYYYKAILWAVEKGITTGTGDKFSPLGYVTRGQFVTFLYRLKGKPSHAVADNPFSDLKENEYYYDAVLWAFENGITTGYSNGTFAPDKTCARGEVVTFLWRVK